MIHITFPISKLEFWPKRLKQVSIVAVFFLVFILGFIFFVQAVVLEIYQSDATRNTLKQELAQQYSDLANIKQYEAEVEQLKNIWNIPYVHLLDQNNATFLLNIILQEANNSGITVKAFNRLPMESKGFYNEEVLHLNLSGTYYNFALFCNSLILLKVVVVLGGFNVVLDPTVKNIIDNPMLKVDLNLHLYYPNFPQGNNS